MSNPDDERRPDDAQQADDAGHGQADHDGQQPEAPTNDPFAVPTDADDRGENRTAVYDTEAFDTSRDGGENRTAVYDTEAFDTSRDGGTNDTEVFDGQHEPAAEPPVDFGSDESVPADRPAVDFGGSGAAADRPAVDFGDNGAAPAGSDDSVPDELRDVERDPDFASNEQRAGDDSLEAPGTPPATIDIDHPDASDTRPNPMVDAPAVQDGSSDDDNATSVLPTGTDAPHSSDERHDDQGTTVLPAVSDADRTDADRTDAARTDAPTAAYDRFPAAAAAPPLVEPAKPVEPERTTPIGAYVPLEEPAAAPTSPAGSPVDDTDRADTNRAADAETTRFPAAAPLPPVVQDRQPEPVGAEEPVHGTFPEPTPAAVPTPITHEDVLERQREAYAGFKWGSGFYGAIAMTGVFVLLSAIVGLVAGLFGLGNMQSISDGSMGVESIVPAVVVAVILFVSAMCGGYVAGRMARFAGVKQGLATWFWGLLFAVVAGLLGWAYGSNNAFDMGKGDSMTMGMGFSGDNGVLIGIGVIVVVLALTLLGAIAGGALGMPYHRRVDRAGFDTRTD